MLCLHCNYSDLQVITTFVIQRLHLCLVQQVVLVKNRRAQRKVAVKATTFWKKYCTHEHWSDLSFSSCSYISMDISRPVVAMCCALGSPKSHSWSATLHTLLKFYKADRVAVPEWMSGIQTFTMQMLYELLSSRDRLSCPSWAVTISRALSTAHPRCWKHKLDHGIVIITHCCQCIEQTCAPLFCFLSGSRYTRLPWICTQQSIIVDVSWSYRKSSAWLGRSV